MKQPEEHTLHTTQTRITHERLILEERPAVWKSTKAFLESFKIDRIPRGPGCYIMMDTKERPIYVGKAKNLRARIRNYINETDSRYSVKFLMRRVAHIDFLLTNNEKEALLLENSLIKENKPRYNVRLKDDKTFISLRLDTREDFPRVTIVRRYKKDGAKYFGPYHSAAAVRQTLRQIQRLFTLRTCTDHVMHNRTRPCLYHQMGQCAAPCVDYVDRDRYREIVDQVVLVLAGRSSKLDKMLLKRIREHSNRLEFEQAAGLRDKLYALRRTMERQRTVDVAGAKDRDVFGLHRGGGHTEVQVLFYRAGKMIGGRVFSFKEQKMPLDEVFGSFLLQYYTTAPFVPSEVLTPIPLEEMEALSEILSDQRGTKVRVLYPQRGEKRALIDLARRNAQRSFMDKQLTEKAQTDTLEQVKHVLKLPRFPQRIECFDISAIQGTNTVGSMVTFEGGVADKSRYRRFLIRSVEGQDDFASMREVLLRRYTRAIAENDLPDFVLIDGGKGQLGVATAVFSDLGIEDLPHAGIAKARTNAPGGRSPERFFLPGRINPIVPRQTGSVVLLLERIRDEAHRFAISYHRKRRTGATLRTALTRIPGVGARRAKVLLSKLGSVTKVREASLAEIAAVPGFSEKLARVVYEAFHKAS